MLDNANFDYKKWERAAEDWQRSASGGSEDALEPWPEPVDLFGGFATPAFPTDVMPEPIRAFAEDQAELIGVDPAILCMTAIAAVAGCLDDRIEIQPKRYDPTWRESARLWVGVIGDPSTKKSPGLKKAMGPVKKVAGEWRKEANEAIKTWKNACEQAKAEDKNAELPERPITKRLTVSDVTVEKLSDIMSEIEPRGILVDKDELTGWLTSMDAYKNGAGGKDKAAWLEAYNGGGLEVDRVTRGSVFVENWSASVIGGIQPQVIEDYANANNHDGMLQRLLLAYAQPSSCGVDRMPDMAAKDAYAAMLEKIARTTPGETVKLTEGAHKVREAFNDRLHKAITSLPNPHLTAMLGKWEGTFARLCLALHAVKCAHAHVHPSGEGVTGDTARAVDRLLWRTLLPHAIKFYGGLDATEGHAGQLAGLLLTKGWGRFTVKRDLHNNMIAYRKMHDRERDEMLDRLMAYGWIAPDNTKLNERGRPAAYHVSPVIHERFADQAAQETERRAKVAGLMQDLSNGEKM